MGKLFTLTLVIPVYNEENQIQDCLKAVSRQTVMPDEVLVIDNNCTDRTIEYARKFPFVRIITETTQGLTPARNHGFNEAKGDILGRIDADAKLDEGWVARVKADFARQKMDGVTGLAYTATIPLLGMPKTRVWSRMYFLWREATFGHRLMWGANMAISRSIWDKIKDDVCLDDAVVHEDQDLSSLIIRFGGTIARDNNLLIHTDGREYNDWPKFYEYALRAHKTKKLHKEDFVSRRARATNLSSWQRMWRYLVTFIPGLFFILSSLIIWAVEGAFRLHKQLTEHH